MLEHSDKQDQATTHDNDQIHIRQKKLAEWRKTGEAYNNQFRRDAWAEDLQNQYGDLDREALAKRSIIVKVAGRMMMRRLMGKASFVRLQDQSGLIQLYVCLQSLLEDHYETFKSWDLGDIIGAEGQLFVTRTGELSIHCHQIKLLSKCLHPLPDKFHGLHDHELRYRQRYLDLLVNPSTRAIFAKRAKTIVAIRSFLTKRKFLEVETPMMQVLPGGALAKPFVTHHNALDIPLYLRVAPELYLKRLVVGGLERVFEINRNFRNEGISTRHNPEFTMVEFYQAYTDYQDLMDLTEELMRFIVAEVLGVQQFDYQGICIDIQKPFARLTMQESILHYYPDVTEQDLQSLDTLRALAERLQVPLDESIRDDIYTIQVELFEKKIEKQLQQPTFITAYPVVVSPLARRSDQDEQLSDRFEFFVAGQEIANGFSELNDPEDQAERFRLQALRKTACDEEAMHYDADYITALKYGMPPTAGEGIGIDRLVMLLTDSANIRDVILFPLLRQSSP